MPRVFVDPAAIDGDVVRLAGEQAHYLARVMRLGPGDAVTVLDGSGMAYEARIEAVSPGRVTARVQSRATAAEPPVHVTLYQALPKADKLEWVIQKATELGASAIAPLATARAVVQLKADKADAKLARWAKIAQEAAEQSERGRIPEILPPTPLRDVELPQGTQAYVLAEREDGLTFPRALPGSSPARIALFVGPEGGWAPEELAWLASQGVVPVSLGRRILRTETAALAALAIVLARYELAGEA